MTKKEIDKIWKKRETCFSKLAMYQEIMDGFFNTRNYNSHIDKVKKKIHSLNEILYKEEKINRKKYAL